MSAERIVVVLVGPTATGKTGLSLALACDMRYVARRARMSTAFAKVGYSGDYGGHYYLHKLIGTARAEMGRRPACIFAG